MSKLLPSHNYFKDELGKTYKIKPFENLNAETWHIIILGAYLL